MAQRIKNFLSKGKNAARRRQDREALAARERKHASREFVGGMILTNGWIVSAFWTFKGFMNTAEETATASFSGSVEALIASIVAAVVVAGCCGLLLGFSGGHDDE